MTAPTVPPPDAPDGPSTAALLDLAEAAIASASIPEATDLVDRVALRPLDAEERLRLLVAEARLAAGHGRVRTAAAMLADAIEHAEALGDRPLARRAAESARCELVQLALRAGQVKRAQHVASTLDPASSARARLVGAAVAVGQGDRSAVDGLDGAADELLVAEGIAASAFVADTVGLALVWAERYDAAQRLLERLARVARREGNVGALPSLLAVQSLGDLRTNRYRAAAARADEAVRLADATDRPGLAALPLAVLAVAEAVRGDDAGCRVAAARLAEDAARAGEAGSLAAEVPARAALGLLHLGLVEPELTVAQLEPLIDRAEATPWLVMWQMDLAEALALVGRSDDAEAVVATFLDGLGPDHRGRAPAAAARVRALLVADQPERAEELLADAEATYRDIGAPFGIARTLLVRGTLRRRWGRHADGRADLELAEAMLTGIGADGWAAQASAARTAPAGTAPTFDRPEVLTPQELQVAGLVATGRSNREVADALFISVRTVESHLGRIYRKLDVRSRSQLIAGADGWGLRDQATW